MFLGIDIGSVSINIVLLDGQKVLKEYYIRSKGRVSQTLYQVFSEFPEDTVFSGIAFTGSGGRRFAKLLDAPFINEILAHSEATKVFEPSVFSIIEIGGEDSKFVEFVYEGGEKRIGEFSMNTVCAAGTGSFLEQQAERMGISIYEFGKLALSSKNPARIAGRCSVFAKSDMIHLQQLGTPQQDICAGLCYALTRTYLANVAKREKLKVPISFQGGVAANPGMRKAFLDVLNIEEKDLIIPRYFKSMGAIGACLLAERRGIFKEYRLFELKQALVSKEPSVLKREELSLKNVFYVGSSLSLKKKRAYLGIDVGSVSTDLVLIDEDGKPFSKYYLKTLSKPIEAIKKGISLINDQFPGIEILGVGTTGSGRHLAADFVGADLVKNEIICQAKGALYFFKDADTIFEIGGQDSKYIAIDNGNIVDFEMNKACAAGTGSFLEEQAKRLGIPIEKFGELALLSKSPLLLGDRCTVFMASDIVHHMQQGQKVEDIISGLCYAVVLNYLNRVVCGKRIGENIVFQGGVAANVGVCAAFAKILGKKIYVPRHHEVTGAVGAALLCKEKMERSSKKTSFSGFSLLRKRYAVKTFECKKCENLCEIKVLKVEGRRPVFYGSRCGRFEDRTKTLFKENLSLFYERERIMQDILSTFLGKDGDFTIIIPKILFFHEFLPFFVRFFREIGASVKIHSKSNKSYLKQALARFPSETCFPLKVAFSYLVSLEDEDLKDSYIFLPTAIEILGGLLCPYIQSFPHISAPLLKIKEKIVKIPTRIREDGDENFFDEISKRFRLKDKIVKKAYYLAFETQKEFWERILKKAEELTSQREKIALLISRPYTLYENLANLDVPKKIASLGYFVVPFDTLVRKDGDSFWFYGRRILGAAKIAKDTNFFPIYLTNFSCGPDSFLIPFFEKRISPKRYLQLELDEHTQDVGIQTRIEAFFESEGSKEEKKFSKFFIHEAKDLKKRTIFVPYMCDHAKALVSAFSACGFCARLMPESNSETIELGKTVTTGKECYPLLLTCGDLLRVIKETKISPKELAFFLPSGRGPCRFGNYSKYHRMVLDRLGYFDVPIFSPVQDENFYKSMGEFGNDFIRISWQGVLAIDFLQKAYREKRPYVRKEDIDEIYNHYLSKICLDIERKILPTDTLKEAIFELSSLEEEDLQKPSVGIVGEIYLRTNRFANDNLEERLYELGLCVFSPPVFEWIFYINYTSIRRSPFSVGLRIKDLFQKLDKFKFEKVVKDALFSWKEPSIKELISLASPYLDPMIEGEAILSVGKGIDFARNGVFGLINVMPFTCMPGTVTSCVLGRSGAIKDGFPFLTLIYDGQLETNSLTRIEAFSEQVKEKFYGRSN